MGNNFEQNCGMASEPLRSISAIQHSKAELESTIMSLIRAFETNNRILISELSYENSCGSKMVRATIKI